MHPSPGVWHTPIPPALGRLRLEDLEFQADLDYIARQNRIVEDMAQVVQHLASARP
jgi:hypothetical protein